MTELSWDYIAEATDGSTKRGLISAPDKVSAIRKVQADKLIPVSIEQSRSKTSRLSISILNQTPKMPLPILADFCRSLSDLLDAGISAGKALELLSSQANGKLLQQTTHQLSNSVRSGLPLSNALEQCEPKFPRLVVAMAAAGENTGKLSEQFITLAEHYESHFKFKRGLVSQLIYPAALLVLIVLTIVFLSYFVLPQFETIFDNAEMAPPIETQIVIAGGKWLRSYALFFPLILFIGLILGRAISKRYRSLGERIALRAPFLGKYWRKICAGRYSRSLGALLIGGASMTSALNIAQQAVSSRLLREAYEDVSKRIRSGSTFSSAISESGLFPKNILGYISLGDEIGTLGPMLLKSAERCDQDVKTDLTKITNLIGPIMTAIMGLLTAGVIAAVMSGVLSLNDTVY